MASNDARNLLHALLVQRVGFVKADDAIEAVQSWQADSSRAMLEVFVDRGLISGDARSAIEVVADELVRAHGGEQTVINELAGVTTRESAAAGSIPELMGMSTTFHAADGPNGRYHIREPIDKGQGKGGMGEVCRGWDRDLERMVAIKRILGDYAESSAYRARFLREALIHAKLTHPGIVSLHDIGREPGGAPFSVMRYVDGATLLRRIQTHYDTYPPAQRGSRDERLAFHELLQRFAVICETIEYAHRQRVWHRDLSPRNIILGDLGESLVLDWGLAKDLSVNDPIQDPAPGSRFGTLPWSSPEHAEGRIDRIGACSDIYGLGANLYLILTGAPPVTWADDDPADKSRAVQDVIRGTFPRPSRKRPDVPRALEAICLKAMARRPEDRYASAEALAADIKRYLADEPVSAYRDPLPVRAFRWARRHRTAVTAAAVLVVTTLAASSVANVMISQQRNRAARFANDAMDVIKKQLIPIGDDVWAMVPNGEERRLAMVQLANREYRSIQSLASTDPIIRLRATIGEAEAYWREGNLNRVLGRWVDASILYDRALQLLADLPAEQRSLPDVEVERSYILKDQLLLRIQSSDHTVATEYPAAIANVERLAQEIPKRSLELTSLAAAMKADYGTWLVSDGRAGEAIRFLMDAVATYDRQPAGIDSDLDPSRLYLAASLNDLSKAHDEAAHSADALDAATRALSCIDNAIDKSTLPGHPLLQTLRAIALTQRVRVGSELINDKETARKWLDDAIRTQQRCRDRHPNNASHHSLLADSLTLRGELLYSMEDTVQALDSLRQAENECAWYTGNPRLATPAGTHLTMTRALLIRSRIRLKANDLAGSRSSLNYAKEQLRQVASMIPRRALVTRLDREISEFARQLDELPTNPRP
ncbi:MAG: protein kinase domain-containing protein [Planctomycetota bacterium]